MNKETLDHLELCIFAEQTHDINFHNIAKELFREVYFQKNIVDQLTNNWNELEELILKEIEKCKEDEKLIRQNKIPKFYDIGVCAGIHGTCKFILDKMKEIKEKSNGN